MPTGIEVSAGIVVGANKPVEAKYGPYASTAAALSDIGSTLRYKGLTVGIESGGSITEYWFKNGTADSDFIVKTQTPAISDITGLQTALDARSPTTHTHGNLTNAGAIGTTSGVPVITGTGGVLQAGSFGTATGTFCQGNDARLLTLTGGITAIAIVDELPEVPDASTLYIVT